MHPVTYLFIERNVNGMVKVPKVDSYLVRLIHKETILPAYHDVATNIAQGHSMRWAVKGC